VEKEESDAGAEIKIEKERGDEPSVLLRTEGEQVVQKQDELLLFRLRQRYFQGPAQQVLEQQVDRE